MYKMDNITFVRIPGDSTRLLELIVAVVYVNEYLFAVPVCLSERLQLVIDTALSANIGPGA